MNSPLVQPDARLLVDCRWLGRAGLGRATELLLRGLQRLRPPGRWVLWGPESVESFLWEGAELVSTTSDPTALWGQQALDIPSHDVALHLNQMRPLVSRRAVTLIHDTIPLRYSTGVARALRLAYLRAIAKTSRRVITVSEYARRTIAQDLGLDPTMIEVVHYPVDDELVARIFRLRAQVGSAELVVAVGRDAPHKNLNSLIEAFARTEFAASGGELTIAGTQESARAQLTSRARDVGARISVLGVVAQEDLETMYATARALVMPSLEEGFGLPAWEAMCCGLPAALANAGALPEIGKGVAHFFEPTALDEIAGAIDRAVRAPEPSPMTGPTLEEFAASFVRTLGRAL